MKLLHNICIEVGTSGATKMRICLKNENLKALLMHVLANLTWEDEDNSEMPAQCTLFGTNDDSWRIINEVYGQRKCKL